MKVAKNSRGWHVVMDFHCPYHCWLSRLLLVLDQDFVKNENLSKPARVNRAEYKMGGWI